MTAQILVVDDEPIIVDVLSRFLKREGYEVISASNGLEALDKVRLEQPDLILLDVTMPVMDGFTACRRLKEDEQTALIPIIILTGLDDTMHRTRGIEAGADDFFTKPFERMMLGARIRALLRTKSLIDKLRFNQKGGESHNQISDVNDLEHNHYIELIKIYQERLYVLNKQSASYELNIPDHIQIEIDDIKNKINDLRQKLQKIPIKVKLVTSNISLDTYPEQELQQLRRLRVFLCHSSNDKPIIRTMYQWLHNKGFEPWLDEENILPGQDWDLEISKAVGIADVVLVCLSKESVSKTGYVQKEIRYALDIADRQPEDVIFIIPLKLQECDVPKRLQRWQWVNLFEDEERGYRKLFYTLSIRAIDLGLTIKPD